MLIKEEYSTTDYILELENKIQELEDKLTNAYSINAREASMEAEKIRDNLSKQFTFLYEDYQEYIGSNVSEENYLSLLAILKKVFRALERNGIKFK